MGYGWELLKADRVYMDVGRYIDGLKNNCGMSDPDACSWTATVKGTPEGWRDSVARLARGNPSMMAGIGAALAAPLIGLAGADGFGIHFYEQSSAGKTTTANIASSLYGEPDALRLTWFGTALGIANEAAAHNDGLMPLDEVGQGADPDIQPLPVWAFSLPCYSTRSCGG